MTSVPPCPNGGPPGPPLATLIPLDSRLCWTQNHTSITDCCAALNGTMATSCGLDQCLGAYEQNDWRDCVKNWYLDNDVDLETVSYSCFPRAGIHSGAAGTGAVGLDISGAERRRGRSWGVLLVAALALSVV